MDMYELSWKTIIVDRNGQSFHKPDVLNVG